HHLKNQRVERRYRSANPMIFLPLPQGERKGRALGTNPPLWPPSHIDHAPNQYPKRIVRHGGFVTPGPSRRRENPHAEGPPNMSRGDTMALKIRHWLVCGAA